MLNVRFDYGFVGRLFGVPRKFLSQIGAFCASFASGHQIIDVRAPAFPDPEKNPVTVGIHEDRLVQWLESEKFVRGQSAIEESLNDFTDSPTVYVPTGNATVDPALADDEWTACGANGLELDCYFHIQPQESGSNFSIFQRCRLKFSRVGLLVSAKKMDDAVRIQAKNA